MARKCYKSRLKNCRGTYAVTIQPGEQGWIAEVDISNERRPGPAEEIREREKFKLDTSLCKELEDKIVNIISENMNTSAWSSTDMPEIDQDFLCHHLTMDEKVKLVVQRRRKFNEEKHLAIREETQKLFVAGDIREILYPECWRMSY